MMEPIGTAISILVWVDIEEVIAAVRTDTLIDFFNNRRMNQNDIIF